MRKMLAYVCFYDENFSVFEWMLLLKEIKHSYVNLKKRNEMLLRA